MTAAFWHGLYIGFAIGVLTVALPLGRAWREPARRPALLFRRAKWKGGA
jgi:hypothetical protein